MKRILWLLLTSFTLLTCQKSDQLPPRGYPRILTLPASDANEANGITLRGEVLTAGRSAVTEYGFVWSGQYEMPTHSPKFEQVSFKQTLATGPFEARIDFGHLKGTVYKARAYVRTENHLVYGSPILFTSKGCLPPVINSFAPRTAAWGDTVVVRGERFSALREQIKVFFVSPNYGNAEAQVIGTSGQQVVCLVPRNLSQQHAKTTKIQVVVYGQSGTSQDDFTLDQSKPVVVSFSPELGTFGDRILLKGSGFSVYPNQNRVLIGFESASVIAASKTQLTVEVPAGLTRKTNQISVSFGDSYGSGESSAAPGFFTVKPPQIKTLSTSANSLSIIGENFSPVSQKNQVRVGLNEVVAAQGSTSSLLSVALNDMVFPQPTTNFNVTVTATEQTSEAKLITIAYRNQWVKRANERTAPFAADYSYDDRPVTSFVVNNKGYVVLGTPNNYNKSRLYEYSPATYSWQKLADSPLVPGYDGKVASFVVNGTVYVLVGGFSPAFWKYDPPAAQWSRLPNPPGCLTDRNFRGFVLGGKCYVVHERGSCSGTECWAYEPATQQWQSKKGGPNSSWVVGAYEAGNRAFVLARGEGFASYRLLEYIASTDSWVEKAGLDNNTGDVLLGLWVNEQLVLTNGERTYRYEPDQNRWAIQNSRLSGSFYSVNGVNFSVGNQGFLFLKQNLTGSNLHFWEFDPSF